MRFRPLEECKAEYPQFISQIEALDGYLSELSTERQDVDVFPALVARKLAMTEGRTMALLRLADVSGLLEPWYHVLCPQTHEVIGQYRSIDEIPDPMECLGENTYHDRSATYVELVFHLDSRVKNDSKSARIG